jgi:hypothetical protein
LLDGLVADVWLAGDGDLADPAVCGGRAVEVMRDRGKRTAAKDFRAGGGGGTKEGEEGEKKDEALLLHGRNYPTAFIWYLCLHAVVTIVGFPHQA